MKILYGTGNKDKIQAMKSIVKSHNFDAEIYTLKDIGFNEDIIENGKTFEENSEIKARVIQEFCKKNDKLNGEPGIYTARYAGEHATQEQCINKVLDKLKEYTDMNDRTCKFVCVLTAILPNGNKVVARGECNGKIALKHGKLGGLTYGPIFIPDGFEKPMGDMDESQYASVHNHRDTAMNELMIKFKELGY